MKFRECIVTKSFKNLNGYYAEKGAKGVVTADDGGYVQVLFDDSSSHLVHCNDVRGTTLEIPKLNVHIGFYKEVN